MVILIWILVGIIAFLTAWVAALKTDQRINQENYDRVSAWYEDTYLELEALKHKHESLLIEMDISAKALRRAFDENK